MLELYGQQKEHLTTATVIPKFDVKIFIWIEVEAKDRWEAGEIAVESLQKGDYGKILQKEGIIGEVLEE